REGQGSPVPGGEVQREEYERVEGGANGPGCLEASRGGASPQPLPCEEGHREPDQPEGEGRGPERSLQLAEEHAPQQDEAQGDTRGGADRPYRAASRCGVAAFGRRQTRHLAIDATASPREEGQEGFGRNLGSSSRKSAPPSP